MKRALPLAAAALGAVLGAQAPSPDVSYVQFPNGCLRDAVLRDLDGDGRDDLIVSVAACANGTRHLSAHRHGTESPSFRSAADGTLPLVADVVAYALADVTPAPGAEVVLFSPTRAVAVEWDGAAAQPKYVPLARIEFLWQPADPMYAFAWQSGVVDLDGDGLDDLVLPGPDDYTVLVQRRDADGRVTFVTSHLVRPIRPVTDRQRGETRFRSQGGRVELAIDASDDGARGPLFELAENVAAPQFADWNGDGRTDVCALLQDRFVVFEQAADASFPNTPSADFTLPEHGIKLFDPSRHARIADLDGDRRAELLLSYGRTDNDTISSVVELIRNTGTGEASPFDAPADRMLFQGFVAPPTTDDIDGDGIGDLAIGSLRTDLIDTLTAGKSGELESQLNVFLGRGGDDGGRFQRPVALAHRIMVPGSALRSRGHVLARFLFDVDHDGTRDLFLRTNGRDLAVLPVARDGRKLTLGEPVWSLATTDGAPHLLFARNGSLSIVLVEPSQVVCVEFR